MMGTFTSFLNLFKPNPTEVVNVTSQLNNNYDLIDAFAAGIRSVNVPSSPIASGANASAYSVGVTIMRLTASDISGDPSWAVDPGATSALVVTWVPTAGDRAVQQWFRGTTTVSSGWYRYLTTSTVGPWTIMGGLQLMSVYDVGPTSIPNSTWTEVGCGTISGNTQGGQILTSASSGVKIGKAGTYRVNAFAHFNSGGSSGLRALGIDLTGVVGSPDVFSIQSVSAISGEHVYITTTKVNSYSVNDVVKLYVEQASGASVNLLERAIQIQYIGEHN